MAIITLLKELFLIVGAGLGIIAFIKTMLDPILADNQRRWEEIKKRVTEEVFQDLEYQVWELTDRCAEKLTLPGRRMGYGGPTLGIPGLEGMAADAGGDAEARGLVPAEDRRGAWSL
ncbi:MAG TPA: hypothetical protein VFT74_06705 [Isosphaeraceae bacterium]|nr:hypothetical protein [Isosphaeraceae bacterium]